MNIRYLAQDLQIPWEGSSPTIKGPSSFTNLTDLINTVISNYIFPFAGIALLVAFISAGYMYLTSAGDTKKMEGAKQRMTNALIGIILIISAYWIVQIAGQIFGLKGIENIFGGGQSATGQQNSGR